MSAFLKLSCRFGLFCSEQNLLEYADYLKILAIGEKCGYEVVTSCESSSLKSSPTNSWQSNERNDDSNMHLPHSISAAASWLLVLPLSLSVSF